MKVTNLALHHVYFEEIRKGLKKVEYRKMDDYYINKFLDLSKYKGMTTDQIKTHLIDGGKVYKNDVTHIMFFENGRKMLCEIKDIKTYKEHKMFAISLGKHELVG